MKKWFALLTVFGLLFVGACTKDDKGSDDESTDDSSSSSDTADDTTDGTAKPEEVAFDDWVDDANDICVDFVDELETQAEDLGAAVDDGDFEAQADLYQELADTGEEQLITPLEELGTPDENADDVEELIGLYNDQIDLFGELADAAADEDDEKIADLFDEGSDVGTDADDLAETLGVDECITDTSNSSDTTDTTTGDGGLDSNGQSEGMAGDGVIDAALLEADIESEYEAQLGLTIDVTCPVDQPLLSGDVFECEGPDEEGDIITFEVTQRDEFGNVTYESVAVNGVSL